MKRTRWCVALSLPLLQLVAGTEAMAVDWGGYLRAGPGSTKKNASRACYGLNGPALKYRLGNECDIYGEFTLTQAMQKNDVDYKVKLMSYIWNGQTDSADARFGLQQMMIEMRGVDFAPQTTFWAGKRFYARHDIHIVDQLITDLGGVGAGAEIPVFNGANLGVSYFKTDLPTPQTGMTSSESGNRLSMDLSKIAVNQDGTVRFVSSLTKGNYHEGTSGFSFSAQHDQEKFFGGVNTLWLQYAKGSAALTGNFGDLERPSGGHSFRVVDSVTWQVGALGGQALALWQSDRDPDVKTDSVSVGGRVSYALTRNFKLVNELGYSQKRPDNGTGTQKLVKYTFAPVISPGPDFWSRPELRLYVTTAKWNQAANQAAGPNGLTVLGNNETRGTSYGAQAEIWF